MISTRHYAFPIAPHSYFTLINRSSEKERFLAGEVINPAFTYRLNKNEQDVTDYMQQVATDPATAKGLALVRASLRLRADPTFLNEFRKVNEELYGPPQGELAQAILSHYGTLAKDGRAKKQWDEITKLLGFSITPKLFGVGPSPEDFAKYRDYLLRYVALPPESASSVEAIQFLLEATGLSAKGWRLRLLRDGEHAHTHQRTKTISIGENYSPRSSGAPVRIAAHEVIGHALRGAQSSLDEAEGVAVMLEQLSASQFKLRRSYRYLAVALGWGSLGKPMTFREVYEVLWRVMVVGGKKTTDAKSHAYDECCRAFRGGRPDVAGAVFLKDAAYFDANIRIWRVLVERKLSYNNFIDVIEGREAILS